MLGEKQVDVLLAIAIGVVRYFERATLPVGTLKYLLRVTPGLASIGGEFHVDIVILAQIAARHPALHRHQQAAIRQLDDIAAGKVPVRRGLVDQDGIGPGPAQIGTAIHHEIAAMFLCLIGQQQVALMRAGLDFQQARITPHRAAGRVQRGLFTPDDVMRGWRGSDGFGPGPSGGAPQHQRDTAQGKPAVQHFKNSHS